MRENTSVGRDSIRTFGFSIGQSVFGLLTGIAVAKALGPAGKGEYGLLQLFQAAAAGVTGNLGLSITYELTRKRKQLSTLARPLGVLLLALSAIEWLIVGVWVWLRGPDPAPLLFAAAVPALIMLSWQGPIFLGLGWIRSLNLQGLYFAVGTFAAAIITLYVFHLGTLGAMWGWVASVWAIAISIVARTFSELRGDRAESTGAVIRELLVFGMKTSISGIFGFINTRIDQIAIVTVVGASAFGIYTVAVSACETLLRISRSVAQAATKRVGHAERSVAAQLAAKSSRAAVAIILIAGLLLFVTAPWLVDLLYGKNFHAAVDALRILLPGIAALSCTGILGTFFNYQLGRPMFLVYSSIGTAIVQTSLCFILVPRMGLNGAALATTITYLNLAVLMTWYFCKHSGLRPVEVWIPTLADMRAVVRGFRRRRGRGIA